MLSDTTPVLQEELKPTPSLKTEFEDEEFSFAYPDGIENDFWNIARNKVVHRLIRRYDLSNILDVGCGRGIATNYLFSRGVKITGVELGVCRPIAGNAVIHYNTSAIHLPLHIRLGIRTIILLDVIEHIKDPERFIKELKVHFINLQYLLITVPACKELWSNYDEFYGHFRRYSPEMLKQTMTDTGFKLVHRQYFFHPLYWLLRLQTSANTNRKIKLSAPQTTLSKIIHKMMAISLYLDALIMPGNMKGSSLVCVAKIDESRRRW